MQAIRDLIPSVLANLQTPDKTKRSKLLDEWESIAGKMISGHSKPFLGREGRLYVWVDSSALTYELSQRYRQSLLKRAQAVFGEEEIKSVHFRVGQIR